ncbi:hypothetical protein KKH15_00940 [Patescibacteria group bacterium]|nr:hypothetical protein [Patescibacteria group bacterium]MBU1754795.1 hypothetical protein [Patescibacteria group bacterium]
MPEQTPSGEKKKMRINPIVGILMLLLAFLIDVAQVLSLFLMIIPDVSLLGVIKAVTGNPDFGSGPAMAIGIGWYLGILGLIGIGFWLLLLKVTLTGKGAFVKSAAAMGTLVVESLPLFNVFPWLSTGTAVIMFETIKEDLGIKIGLLDAAMFLIPGGQGLAVARAAGTAAKAAKAAEAAKEVSVAQKAARAAKTARKVRQADVGPGVRQQQKQIDINRPYRREEAASTERFADPYVPVNDDETEEEGRWVA